MTETAEIIEAVETLTTLVNIIAAKHVEQTQRLRGLMQSLNALEDGLNCPDEVS